MAGAATAVFASGSIGVVALLCAGVTKGKGFAIGGIGARDSAEMTGRILSAVEATDAPDFGELSSELGRGDAATGAAGTAAGNAASDDP